MNAGHIAFEKLSDFCDDCLQNETEKKTIQSHLKSCRACRDEFERLKKTIGFCAEIGAHGHFSSNLSGRVVDLAAKRRRRRVFFKAVPAAAAAVVIISGIAFFRPGGDGTMGGIARVRNEAARHESEQIIDIIRNNKASLVRVSDEFIEGRVSIAHYNKLRKDLRSRKVAFSQPFTEGEEAAAAWSPMEEVAAGDMALSRETVDDNPGERYVFFRVYRK